MSDNKGNRALNLRGWTGRLAIAALTCATATAWSAPVKAGITPGKEGEPTQSYRDAEENVAFTGVVDYRRIAASLDEGKEKPSTIFWTNGKIEGAYPYAALGEASKAAVDAELAKFLKEEAERVAQEEEKRKRVEFYDAKGNIAFIGRVVVGKTASTARDGGKPELVFWSRFTEGLTPISKETGEPAPDGSYPYALLSEEDQTFVDAELAKAAEQKEAFEKAKKAAAEAKANWEKEAPQTPEVQRVEGRKFAALIGCGVYADESISPLQFAAADAKLLAARMRERGVDEREFAVLTQRDATRATIAKTINVLAEITKPGDMIFVAFSGQGFEKGGETYWVPYDADMKKPTETCVSLNDFIAELDVATPGRVKAILFDACRGGTKEEGEPNGDGATARQTSENVWTFYACEPGGVAFESDALQRGVFTYCFAEGLTERGDANGDGVVTLMEAFFYAKARTKATVAQELNGTQTPTFVGPFADLAAVELNDEASNAENASK